MVAATSSRATRSRSRTGKHSRQLVSEGKSMGSRRAPEPLPLPLQPMVAEPTLKINKLAESGHEGAKELRLIGWDRV